jgi:hypothetical protein
MSGLFYRDAKNSPPGISKILNLGTRDKNVPISAELLA